MVAFIKNLRYKIKKLRKRLQNHKKSCYYNYTDDTTLKSTKERNDTMSAVARNCVYELRVKKGVQKSVPVVDKKRVDEFKKTVAKYLDNK